MSPERARWRLFGTAADLGIAVTAPTLAGVFRGAAEALASAMADRRRVRPREVRRVTLSADDRESLLVAWLNELIYIVDSQRFLLRRFRLRLDGERSLTAEIAGETHDPTRHRLGTLVKAATWHDLSVARAARGWRARVVLDV